MREIKFRGKDCVDNWHYGNLITVKIITDERKIEVYSIRGITTDNHTSSIKKETVGQFTGLKDKNEKEAFFDDIVKFTQTWKCGDKIKICDYMGVISYNKYMQSCIIVDGREFHIDNIFHGEVIGNIHDNPELIK